MSTIKMILVSMVAFVLHWLHYMVELHGFIVLAPVIAFLALPVFLTWKYRKRRPKHKESHEEYHAEYHEEYHAEYHADGYSEDKTCLDCHKKFARKDLWQHTDDGFICRGCLKARWLKRQTSFKSPFRKFRERVDYVAEEPGFAKSGHRISDAEFDQIIREFEMNHWSDITDEELQMHTKYIESLLKREFCQRRLNEEKSSRHAKEEFGDADSHYSLLGVSKSSTDEEVKRAYRRLVIKWHPDKNPDKKRSAEKMSTEINLAYEKIMECRR